MNLLIVGAGGHGRVVKEVAEATGNYQKIDFLDDCYPKAVGKCADYEAFINDYQQGIVAFGNNELRQEWLAKLNKAGFFIPVLAHPTAYLSPTSRMESGVVVLPKASLNTNVVIGEGTIIGMGSLVDHDVTIGSCCHINTGAIIPSHCMVDKQTKVNAGEIYSSECYQ